MERDDLERLNELMARLLEWQDRCSCATTPVTECPNYLPGDEEYPTPWN